LFDAFENHPMKANELTAILNGFPEPVLLLDADLIILAANSAFESTFNSAIKGSSLVNALRWPEVLQCAKSALVDGSSAQSVVRSPDAAQVTWSIHANPLNSSGTDVPVLMLSLRDVSHVEEAERMRSVFVANVSHELRSPLTALTGFIETLKGPASQDPDARTRFLDIMEREAARMDRLIVDLLSLSGIEVNRHIRPSATVDLVDVISEVIDTLSPTAQASDRDLCSNSQVECAPVLGDHDQLLQVFRNLIENALKYGEEATPVRVNVSRLDRYLGMSGAVFRVDVIDQGAGISTEHLPRLTERFYRVEEARSRAKGGTGLGLAIVKHIVNRHHGRLMIESELSVGSTFSVFLSSIDASSD